MCSIGGLKFSFAGIEYLWVGKLENLFYSLEWRPPVIHTTRLVGSRLYYASSITPMCYRIPYLCLHKVTWSADDPDVNSSNHIEAIKREIFLEQK